MAKSGNPAVRAAQALVPSSVSDVKGKKFKTLELPSGTILRVKNPGGMTAFLTNGTIPNRLMGVIQKSLDVGKAPAPEDVIPQEGVDAEFVAELGTMMDRILCLCAVEPTVMPTPENEVDRLDTQLYADEFPDDDKMFIFQWVSGGTEDLEQFRNQHTAGMAPMAAVAVTRGNTQ